MTVIQLGQFAPQLVTLVQRKSVVGLSPWMLFFSSIYNYLAALDLLLSDSATSRSMSSSVSPSIYRAFISAQPVFQLVGSAILSALMWPLYLRHLRPFRSPPPFTAFLVSAALSTLLALPLFALPEMLRLYATTCGLLAAIANGLMWLPQITLTEQLEQSGALSPLWVFASLLADVLFSFYLIAENVHWSVWANNVPDGVFAAWLLVILARCSNRSSTQLLPLLSQEEDEDEQVEMEENGSERMKMVRVEKNGFVLVADLPDTMCPVPRDGSIPSKGEGWVTSHHV